jgi:hypothetical protein
MMTKAPKKPPEEDNIDIKFELEALQTELIAAKIKRALVDVIENEKPKLFAAALMMLSASLAAFLYRNPKDPEQEKELIKKTSDLFTEMIREYMNQYNKADND